MNTCEVCGAEALPYSLAGQWLCEKHYMPLVIAWLAAVKDRHAQGEHMSVDELEAIAARLVTAEREREEQGK